MIVAWSAIALMSTAETAMYAARTGLGVGFWWMFLSQAPGWLMWAAVTTPIVRVTRRLPVWPPRLPALVAHAALCVAVAVGFVLVGQIALTLFPWGTPPAGESFVAAMWRHLTGWAPSLVIAYAAVVGAGQALAYAEQVQRAQREKAALATQLVEAQLGALRMQLQPHFLFNTLNSIAMLVRSADNARAVEMIALLGEVLRTLLKSSSDLESTLAAEVALLRRYLEIEEIRFGDRLRVRWQIADDAAHVPSLILQPIVENALRHGLWPRAEGGELVIAARRLGDALQLEVSDDGVGLPAGFEVGHSRGVGLANVRTRLERMYGAAGTLEVGRRPRGVVVTLTMPFQTEPQLGGAHG